MKISLLPAPIREQINRRLETGEPDAPLLAWLQSLPEVLALNAASYDGHPLNQDDLAAWKLSRFRQLRLCATALQAVQSLLPHAAQIQQAAPAPVTDQLAACLASAVAAAWLRPASNEDDSAVLLQRLQELGPLLALLRRGDQNSQWLQIQRQWVALATQKHQDRLAAQKTKTGLPFRFPNPDAGISEETIARIEHDLKLF